MILFLKYLVSSLLISAAAALVLFATNVPIRAIIPGTRFSPERVEIALILAGVIFILLLTLFPILVGIQKRSNPDQKITLAALHSAQMHFLSSLRNWLQQKLFWILGGFIAIAAIMVIVDSVR